MADGTLLGGPTDDTKVTDDVVDDDSKITDDQEDKDLDLITKDDDDPSIFDGDDDEAAQKEAEEKEAAEKEAAEKEAAEKEAAEKEAADKEAYDKLSDEEKAKVDKEAEEKAAKEKADADKEINLVIDKDVKVDEAVLTKFKDLAKEQGLNSEQAQKFLDLQVELAKKGEAEFTAEQESWLKAIKEDTEYGHDNYDKSVIEAKKAMDAFTTPELRKLLNLSGFGDHPELFKFAVNVGRAMGEADFIDGKHTLTPDERDAADVMFDDMNVGQD